MRIQGYPVEAACAWCGEPARLLDETGACERCALAADGRAARLSELEELLDELLEAGVTEQQLAEALSMRQAGAFGRLTSDPSLVRRDQGDGLPASWIGESAFLADDDQPPSPLRRARIAASLALEDLAARVNVDPAELALWEAGAPIPPAAAAALGDVLAIDLTDEEV